MLCEWHEWNGPRLTDQLSEICKSLCLHQTVNNKSLIDQKYSVPLATLVLYIK